MLHTRAGVVLVSHDRAFLEAAIDRVVEIDEFTHGVREFRGGWTAYLAEREARRRQAVEAYDTYTAERERLVDAARRKREWAQTGMRRASAPDGETDKNIRHRHVASAQRQASGAAKLLRRIDRLDARAPDDVRQPWRLNLTITGSGHAGARLLELREAVIHRGPLRLGPVSLTVGRGERVRLAGPNGVGKTTLVDALAGRLPLAGGERYIGPSAVIGELDQQRTDFHTDVPVVDVVSRAAGLDLVAARTLLAKFRLPGDQALRPAQSLSPGERTRAGLALLQARSVNCLVLDEPTNHLDIEAIEQLEQALDGYTGTILLITHDRRFADAVAVDRTVQVGELTVTP